MLRAGRKGVGGVVSREGSLAREEDVRQALGRRVVVNSYLAMRSGRLVKCSIGSHESSVEPQSAPRALQPYAGPRRARGPDIFMYELLDNMLPFVARVIDRTCWRISILAGMAGLEALNVDSWIALGIMERARPLGCSS